MILFVGYDLKCLRQIVSEIFSLIMYVCIELALREMHIGSAVQLGLGERPIKSGSNVPTPLVPSIPRHTRWLILAHSVCVL